MALNRQNSINWGNFRLFYEDRLQHCSKRESGSQDNLGVGSSRRKHVGQDSLGASWGFSSVAGLFTGKLEALLVEVVGWRSK